MILVIAVLIGVIFRTIKQPKKKSTEKTHKIKLCESDRKIQNRVVKEIENFLNYNGDEQDDIL
ncbi:MAG: hypothetical protein U0L17_03425 [Acutalibacteraceae bacterium]|nr:hypothetical protein [Acutalibacteraceae bacterium]